MQAYCESHFKITFPLFEKVEVRGQRAHPLFQLLTLKAPFQGIDPRTVDGPRMLNFLQEKYPDVYAGDGIKWNFTKFLVDRKGRVCGRYETTAEPNEIAGDIELLL